MLPQSGGRRVEVCGAGQSGKMAGGRKVGHSSRTAMIRKRQGVPGIYTQGSGRGMKQGRVKESGGQGTEVKRQREVPMGGGRGWADQPAALIQK